MKLLVSRFVCTGGVFQPFLLRREKASAKREFSGGCAALLRRGRMKVFSLRLSPHWRKVGALWREKTAHEALPCGRERGSRRRTQAPAWGFAARPLELLPHGIRAFRRECVRGATLGLSADRRKGGALWRKGFADEALVGCLLQPLCDGSSSAHSGNSPRSSSSQIGTPKASDK